MRSRVELSLEVASVAVLLGLVGFYAACPIFSIDFFWHLKLGEVIAQTGAIPRADLFSAVHPDRPYVQFNWLWELLVAWVQSAFGLRGIRALQSFLLVASFALLYRNARRSLGQAALALCFCALALVLFEDRFRARPSALVLGFFAAMLPLLLGGYREAKRAQLAGVFALAVLWANLHGGESLLLVLSLGALFAGELFHRHVLKRPDAVPERAGALLLAALVGLLLSPTLIDGLQHWAVSVGPQIETGNEEWQPSYTMLRNGLRPAFVLIGLGPTAAALIYLVVLVRELRRHGRERLDVSEVLLCAGYLVLAHHAVRNAFLCLLPVLFLLRRLTAVHSVPRLSSAAAVLAALLLYVSFEDAVIQGYGGLTRARALFALDLAPNTYPEHAARFMREAHIRGRVLNDGRWGGYLIWRTWPACSFFADSRHDLTPELWPLFLRSHDPLQRPEALAPAFERLGLELTAFPAPTFPLHVPPADYRLLWKSGEEEIYQHVRGKHARANLRAARDYVRRHGGSAPDDPFSSELGEALTELGGRLWLSALHQRLRMTQAERDAKSPDPAVAAAAQRQRGQLLWLAGDYASALTQLERVLVMEPANAKALHYAALSLYALGDHEGAARHLVPLRALQPGLNREQRARMALLDAALRTADAP